MNLIKNFFNLVGFVIFTILIFGLSLLLLEQSIIAPSTPGYYFDPFPINVQIVLVLVLLFLVLIYSCWLIPKIKLSRNSYLFIGLLFLLLIVGVVNILTMDAERNLLVYFLNGTQNNVTLTLTIEGKITAIISLVTNLVFIYFMVILIPKNKHFYGLVHVVTFLLVVASYVAIIYSFVTERSFYVDFINGNSLVNVVPESFFGNRNPYASFLLNTQIMLTFTYFINKKRFVRFLFIFLQFPIIIAIFLTLSKTNFILAIFIMLSIYIAHVVKLLVNRKFSRLIVLFVTTVFVAFVLWMFRFHEKLYYFKLAIYLKQLFPDNILNNNLNTISERIRLWQYALTLIIASPVTFLFGDGPHLSRMFYFQRVSQETALFPFVGFGDYHNGFIEVLHTFGLSALPIYIIIFFVMFILIIKRGKGRVYLGYFLIISLVTFLARSMTESFSLLLFKSEGIMASLTLILPFLYLMKKYKEKPPLEQRR